MYTFLRFPNFRERALTLSYDDGVIYDKKLIEILDEYGIKATFNINSDAYGKGRRLTLEDAVALYKDSGHEIAVHGEKHLILTEIPKQTALHEILADKRSHESVYGRIVRGMAYACGSYNDQVVEILKSCGIVYARTVDPTESFDIPTDWLRLNPTCHHAYPHLTQLVERFLEENPEQSYHRIKPKLFYLWGHSYEFNDGNCWDIIQNFAKQIGGRPEVWYARNSQVYDYVKAYEQLIFSVDCTRVKNPTAIDLWTCIHGKNTFIPAGAEVAVE